MILDVVFGFFFVFRFLSRLVIVFSGCRCSEIIWCVLVNICSEIMFFGFVFGFRFILWRNISRFLVLRLSKWGWVVFFSSRL